MSWDKLKIAYSKSTAMFHTDVVPNLTPEIQEEIKDFKSFNVQYKHKPGSNNLLIVLDVNGKDVDITEWYKPGMNILDHL